MYLLDQIEILKYGSNNITLYSILRGFLLFPGNKNPVYIQVFLPYFSIFFFFFRLLEKKKKKENSMTKLKEKK